MAERAENLRDSIDQHLHQLSKLEELSDKRYHVTHERFEATSNQRTLIIDWLAALAAKTSFPIGRPTRILSVGCGGGVMDHNISDLFAAHAESLSLVGIDPNPRHTAAFEALLSSEGFEVEVHTGIFEDYKPDTGFDLIHFVHCLYYFEHIEPELRKAVEMLTPGGALVILQAPNEDLNHLADRAWKKQFNQSAWYSDDVLSVLKDLGLNATSVRLNAHVDVTECFEPDNIVGIDILDFIVQAETARFSAAFRASLRESLRSICTRRGNRLVAEHPVDAIMVRRAATA